jgi:hypothetical protein
MREPDKSKKTAWRRVRSACAALGRDRDGSALLYTTLSLPVLIGFAVLAIDGSRLMNLNSTLQHAADGLALAAAGELDRKPDACERAERALENLVQNDQMFGDLGAATITIDDVEWTLLSELPANDWDPIPASMVVDPQDPCDADSAREARYIEVWVKPQNFNTLFPASFLGGSNTARTNAVAVAGFDAAVCEFMPIFICNPYEGQAITIHEAAADPDELKRQIRFHTTPGSTSQLTPGAFGLLQPPGDPPTLPQLKDMLAVDKPPACFIQNGVSVKPGISGVGDWLNVRFDLYRQGSTASLKDDEDYRPAHNVRKGYKIPTTGPTPQCNKVPDDTNSSKGLPRDDCFEGAPPYTCDGVVDAWFGTGNFAAGRLDEYWSINYQTTVPPEVVGMSRYEIYRYEMENGMVDDQSNAPTQETGELYCSSSATSPDPDRRIVYAAVLNCIEHEIRGNSNKSVPVEAFAEFFITEPVQHEPSNPETIWVELKGIVEPGTSTVARDRVQLYR